MYLYSIHIKVIHTFTVFEGMFSALHGTDDCSGPPRYPPPQGLGTVPLRWASLPFPPWSMLLPPPTFDPLPEAFMRVPLGAAGVCAAALPLQGVWCMPGQLTVAGADWEGHTGPKLVALWSGVKYVRRNRAPFSLCGRALAGELR